MFNIYFLFLQLPSVHQEVSSQTAKKNKKKKQGDLKKQKLWFS